MIVYGIFDTRDQTVLPFTTTHYPYIESRLLDLLRRRKFHYQIVEMNIEDADERMDTKGDG